jgi:hypothetical protein
MRPLRVLACAILATLLAQAQAQAQAHAEPDAALLAHLLLARDGRVGERPVVPQASGFQDPAPTQDRHALWLGVLRSLGGRAD